MATIRRAGRRLVRGVLLMLAVFLTSPLWILDRLEAALGGEAWFNFCSELLSLVPGAPGVHLRRGFYRMSLEAFGGEGVSIGFGTTLSHREARIGRRVYIGHRCTIGRAVIGDDAVLGSNVDVLSGGRQHDCDDLSRPIQEQGGSFRQIRIGANSWIGNSSVVMNDVGDRCIIGAGSVVVRSIPDRTVAVGNPAAVKKHRAPAS